jgi:hypothetical protein
LLGDTWKQYVTQDGKYCDPSQENQDKLAQVIIEKIAKKEICFVSIFNYFSLVPKLCTENTSKHDFCSILKLFSKAKQM